MSRSKSFDPLDGVAIIGVACRFPGAKNVDEFWRNLRDGVESISFFSDQELAAEGVSPALLADPNYVKAGAVLEGVKLFDAGFFGYSPREAELMDPQQRLFLECAWTALEVAGYSPETYSGQIGVYAGSRVNEYLLNNLYPDGERFGLRNRTHP
jgi:acyl transferase domain-containing protein